MGEVLDELARVIGAAGSGWWLSPADARTVASEVLEWFEVTPKTGISDEELGQMVARVFISGSGVVRGEKRGRLLRQYLADAGVEIVRKEAGRG